MLMLVYQQPPSMSGSLIALIVIIAGFTWLAPAKIRKYE